ncbi:ferredoxin [Nocardia sp. NPDC051030]|uniref:ferredoxin n=1 Tax=Nocardia sp. NPDC051030 TaxID=3155162 RepID=UPI00342E40C6
MSRVEIDPNVCQASGYCVGTAPAIFALGPDGIAEIKDAQGSTPGPVEIPDEYRGLVETATLECPSGAITTSR